MGVRDWFRRSKPTPIPARRQSVRYYTAGTTSRLTSSWTTDAASIDDVTKRDLKVLRARSREQYRNNDYASRFAQLMRSNIVGPAGVVIQATIQNAPTFGGGLDVRVNDAIEAAWAKWGRAANCDRAGRLSWVQMQHVALNTIVQDGEFVAVIDRSAPNPYRFALRVIDPVRLDVDLSHEMRGGNRIRFGVELDDYDRPVAYWFRTAANDPEAVVLYGKGYERVPARDVLHLFVPEYVGQKRGFPLLATALMRLQMLGGYEDAAITAARVGAAKMGFFTSPAGDGYTGSDLDTDGAVITDAQPGTFEQLPVGTTFQSFNPDYPHAQFDAFVKSCLRGISAGLGVSYAAISNDLEGVNYSSIRAGVLEDREAWKALQTWFVDGFARPIYEAWVAAVVTRQVPVLDGGTLRLTDVERYQAASYQPRRWAWVDPQKDTEANILAINAGLKSRGEVIREQGRDPDDVWRELAAERDRLAELGILQPVPAPPADTGANINDTTQI